MKSKLQLADVSHEIDTLLIYRNVKEDTVIKSFYALSEAYKAAAENDNQNLYQVFGALYDFSSDLVEKAEQYGFKGNIFKKCIIYAFLNDENVYSLACEKQLVDKNSSAYKLSLQDMAAALDLMNFDLDELCKKLGKGEDFLNYTPHNLIENELLEQLEAITTKEDLLDAFSKSYNTSGCGVVSHYRTFRFDGDKLMGISNCDKTVFDDIIGYDKQKAAIIDNTDAFLNGYPSNNVLLIGARGTGKSSCIKALYNHFYDRGLCVVEVAKDQLVDLPKIIKLLKNRGKHFILYIDDLSFDEFEVQYKYMKSLLEGGVEKTPDNVLFYATSNRRHLVKEFWSDKQGTEIKDGELHLSDTVNEKLSLSDRFGITVTFNKPTMDEYMRIIKGLADKAGLEMSSEELKAKAHSWELNQHGLSGRTARQFVNYLICMSKR